LTPGSHHRDRTINSIDVKGLGRDHVKVHCRRSWKRTLPRPRALVAGWR